jgi:hypothetical protein
MLPQQIQAMPTVRAGDEEYKVSFTFNELQVIKAGADALRLLTTTRTRSWDMWMAVGSAIVLLRSKAIEASKKRLGYKSTFGDLLAMFRLKLDGGIRKRLLDLMEHRRDVEAWRDSLPPDRALALTHPNSVWRAWQASRSSITIQAGQP